MLSKNIELCLQNLIELELNISEAINQSLYQTHEKNIIALYDYDGEQQYKGITVFSYDDDEIGDVEWYSLDDLKEVHKNE